MKDQFSSNGSFEDNHLTEFYRAINEKRVISNSVKEVLSEWTDGEEGFLFIVPHDDDAVLGVGLLLRSLLREKLPFRIVIATDGSMGYTKDSEREEIVNIRRQETINSFKSLGVSSSLVSWLMFPDLNLWRYRGRRRAERGDPTFGQGMTGLEDCLVREFRRGVDFDGSTFPVTRIFTPSQFDYHNDHVVLAEEVMISIFHATGNIWPECGPQLQRLPFFYQFPVYCDLPENDSQRVLICANREDFQAKLLAIRAFSSQEQIEVLIKGVEADGPIEIFTEMKFKLLSRKEQMKKFVEDCCNKNKY